MRKKIDYRKYLPAAALLCVVAVLFWKYSGRLRNTEQQAIAYLQSGVYNHSLEIGRLFQANGGLADLESQNSQLKAQLVDLTAANAVLAGLKTENEELRNLLSYFDKNRRQKVIAKIIGSDPVLDDTLILDRGSEDGIKEGQPVIAGSGSIIGKIIRTGRFQSTLLLVTDSQLKLSVTTADGVKPIGLAHGEFGLSLTVDLVPQNVDLKEGDTLVTSSLDQEIPAGLAVGKVNRIISRENDLFKKVSLTPLVDFHDLSTVAIITDGHD